MSDGQNPAPLDDALESHLATARELESLLRRESEALAARALLELPGLSAEKERLMGTLSDGVGALRKRYAGHPTMRDAMREAGGDRALRTWRTLEAELARCKQWNKGNGVLATQMQGYYTRLLDLLAGGGNGPLYDPGGHARSAPRGHLSLNV